MAGQLILSTLSDGTNSTSATNPIMGSAKAWVNFNGTSGAIRASYNVSSITKTETSTFRITMTNAMVDTNYVIHVTGKPLTDVVVDGWVPAPDSTYGGVSTNQFPVRLANQTPSLVDLDAVYVSVFR
jgi:hypothetical protein